MPVDPVDPVLPFNPGFPGFPFNPEDPVNPVTPCAPVEPVLPVEPLDPVGPVPPAELQLPEHELLDVPAYGRSFQRSAPFPILNLFVSNSNPNSPLANSGFAHRQLIYVSLLNCNCM